MSQVNLLLNHRRSLVRWKGRAGHSVHAVRKRLKVRRRRKLAFSDFRPLMSGFRHPGIIAWEWENP
jgi:hypothetical protein